MSMRVMATASSQQGVPARAPGGVVGSTSTARADDEAGGRPLLSAQPGDAQSSSDEEGSTERSSDGDGGRTPPKLCGFDLVPPSSYRLEMLFWRGLYDRAERLGYRQKGEPGIRSAVLRRFLRRLTLLFDVEGLDDPVWERTLEAETVSWKDVRFAFEQGFSPIVRLSHVERLWFVFLGRSLVGGAYEVIILGLIFTTVAPLFGLHYPHWLYSPMMLAFTAEYAVKLLIAPFCRSMLRDEDTILAAMVPEDNPNAVLPQDGVCRRLVRFVFDPMHIVDVVAVLPYWMSYAHVNLTCLRMLRLTRVFRLLGRGKFSAEVRVLAHTLSNSSRAIMVVCIYLWVVSVVGAGLLYHLEIDHDPDLIDKMSVRHNHLGLLDWTAAMLTNTQNIMDAADGKPKLFASQLIIRMLGLMKGFIFFLPLGMISALYQAFWKEHLASDKRRDGVARDASVPVRSEWLRDPDQPWARLEVFYQDSGVAAGVGYFSVPLLATRPVEPTLCGVQVRGRGLLGGCWSWRWRRPEVRLLVQWAPAAPPASLPRGELGVTLLRGLDFPAARRGKWRCRVFVPTGLSCRGEHAMAMWETDLSSSAGSTPAWSRGSSASAGSGPGVGGCARSFAVDWRGPAGAKEDAAAAGAPDPAELKRQVLGQVRRQAERLAALRRRPGVTGAPLQPGAVRAVVAAWPPASS